MQWLKRHLTEIFCVLFLTIIVGVVTVRNYTPGTFLTGIDNFHIEFDLGLALSRAWNGVWQENQGLGLVSGLAQMTEIPRVAIYQVLSWVMPMNLIRYVYIFGNLYFGVIGIFFLTWFLSKSRLAGLAGALFYLFNLGTLQVFFMPTEMFVVNYAALPWLFLLVFKYLSEGRRANLWWYAGLLFLFASMAMTPTIFVVYLLFLGIICAGYKWKRVIGIVGLTLGMSMYFLLPFANFVLNNAGVLTESKINSVFSQENYLMNAARTSWSDLGILKGMWFDYPDNVKKQLVPLLGAWDQYLASVGMWIYVPMSMVGIGIVAMLWKRKWQGIAVVVMGVVSLVMLRGENPPVGGLVAWLRSLPLVAEAFRTPHTKIAPILTLVYAICFGYGIYPFGQIWRFKIAKTLWKTFVVGGMVAGLIWLNLPYFQGKLISEGVRVKMPNEYFEMFKFFKTQDKSSRVVRLPAYGSQAWDYTNWEYRGSGFLWYGIEQPLLDRAFDVWSPYNEGFYGEFSSALYGCGAIGSQGSELSLTSLQSAESSEPCGQRVQSVLQKYDVRYVLLDESVIAPGQGKEILRIEETKKLAEELGWEQKFKEGFLTVWAVPIGSDLPAVESAGWALPLRSDPESHGITAPSGYTFVNGDTSKTRKDVIYGDVGTYVSGGQDAVIYPFAGLMREEIKNVEYGEQITTLRSDLVGSEKDLQPTRSDLGSQAQEIIVPGWKLGEIVRVEYKDGDPLPAYYVNEQAGPVFLGKEKPEKGKNIIYARVSDGEEWREYLQESRFQMLDASIKIEVPSAPQIYDFVKEGQGTVGNCDVLKRGVAEKRGTSYVADGRGAVCDYVVTKELDTRLSYLMRVQGENKEGRSVKFFLYNTGSKRNDIEWLMKSNHFDQTFGLLPWSWDGYYTLNIETRSFGQRAENTVNPVEVRWFPIEQIVGARIVRTQQGTELSSTTLQSAESSEPSLLRIAEVKKTGTWLYRVKVEGSGLLKLSQGYDAGWIAPPIKHVKVDGWANGWILRQAQDRLVSEIYIFYWPQLLEYLGFGIFGVTIWILASKRR